MTDLQAAARRLRGRTNHKRGEQAQQVVAYHLRRSGLAMVMPIHTGMTLIRKFDPRSKTSRIVGAVPQEKVQGDFTAIVPVIGRAVLVEVKRREDGILSLSDFADHSLDALTACVAHGGLSLVAFVYGLKVALLEFPIRILEKGKPLHYESAERIAAEWKGIA